MPRHRDCRRARPRHVRGTARRHGGVPSAPLALALAALACNQLTGAADLSVACGPDQTSGECGGTGGTGVGGFESRSPSGTAGSAGGPSSEQSPGGMSNASTSPATPVETGGTGGVPEPASAPPSAAPSADAGSAVAAPTQSFQACTEDGGGCTILNIGMAQRDPPLCVTLTLDDCAGEVQEGLPVATPISWRLGSASYRAGDIENCDGTLFDPRLDRAIVDASGTIVFFESEGRLSDLDVQVTLQPSSVDPGPESIGVTTAQPVMVIDECD